MSRCPRISDFVFCCERASELVKLSNSSSAFDGCLSNKLFFTFDCCNLYFVVDMSEEVIVLPPDQSFRFQTVSDCEEPCLAKDSASALQQAVQCSVW